MDDSKTMVSDAPETEDDSEDEDGDERKSENRRQTENSDKAPIVCVTAITAPDSESELDLSLTTISKEVTTYTLI